jgi:hypothetical protein
MELEGSLSCSQEPATGPYPKPDESRPKISTLFKKKYNSFNAHSHVIFPSTPKYSEWFIPSDFMTKILYAFLIFPIRATCPAHLTRLDLITLVIVGKAYKLGQQIFLFTTASRTTLGPTQPPIECVPRALFLGVKRPRR